MLCAFDRISDGTIRCTLCGKSVRWSRDKYGDDLPRRACRGKEQPGNVGTELTKLLALPGVIIRRLRLQWLTRLIRWLLDWLGYEKQSACGCKWRAREMDHRGAAWCDANRETCLGLLKEGARKSGVPYVRFVAALLLSVAIRRAEQRI